MRYSLSKIAQVTRGTLLGSDIVVEGVIYDTRSHIPSSQSIFVALKASRDGHRYIEQAYKRGIRAFLISDSSAFKPEYGSAVVVADTLTALQQLAKEYRSTLNGSVTAVIGSNGKTIVKEWVWQLSPEGNIYRSPRSYNSQLGVALSLLGSPSDAQNIIIEAGVSLSGEMARLESIVAPERVVITNIGEPHSSGFSSKEEKLSQKLIMAHHAKEVIYPSGDKMIEDAIRELPTSAKMISYGGRGSDISIERTQGGIVISVWGESVESACDYMPNIVLHNSRAAVAVAICCGISLEEISGRIASLQSVAMRLELKSSHGGGVVINDSYNSDIDSLQVALEYLELVAASRERVVVLSDICGSSHKDIYCDVAKMIEQSSVDRFIGIGDDISQYSHLFKESSLFFRTTQELIEEVESSSFEGVALLVKGSRRFELERFSLTIEEKLHTTILEVNLESMVSNLNRYRSMVEPKVKLMAMVKASSYGMGDIQVAQRLQKEGVDYLAVAYADEGVSLRRAAISLPIVVLGGDPSGYSSMIEHSLEPEIYSLYSLEQFTREVDRHGITGYPIHLKIDSGMHRLGFMADQIPELISTLSRNRSVRVASIFSHLAASEDQALDQFTRSQVDLLTRVSGQIKDALGSDIITHICNSAAIRRHSYAHMDMVRLGVGLYQNVAQLKSMVVDVKRIPMGEFVSYNCRYQAPSDRSIAIVAIGYADGLDRRLSAKGWHVVVNGMKAPIIGSICMDTCIIDVTDVGSVSSGDMVQIFGEGNSAEEMAELLGTINYEIYTSISTRVKRVYLKE